MRGIGMVVSSTLHRSCRNCSIDTGSVAWTMVYDLTLPVDSNWDILADVPYSLDASASAPAFTRIGYLFMLNGEWVWTEMDDFTTGNAARTGMPGGRSW